MAEVDDCSSLVIVMDCNPGQVVFGEDPKKFTLILDSLIAFTSCHLMLKGSNKVAFIACDSERSEFIYSDEDAGTITTTEKPNGQYEVFAHVERKMKQNLKKFTADLGRPGESLMAGACSIALCYVNRLQDELPLGAKMNSRILLITGTNDNASQYMTYMNTFFTAQKQGVIIDVCSLSNDIGLLQQGCDITGGIYLKIPQILGFLQYLLWVFLPEPAMRKKLVLPPPVKVDYRAACFCHRQLVDIGYVCSICLSVFCKFSPICTTCQALFKTPGPLPGKSKKKKAKFT